MKKITILTSVLALTACGGGSGGGTAYIPDSITNDTIVAGNVGTISSDVAESNALITSMVSEIGIAEDGSTINIISSRHGVPGHFMHNGKKYTSHKIDEAHFYGSDRYNPDEFITFGINPQSGEIDKVVQHYIEYIDDVPETVKEENKREPKTNIFVSDVYKYTLDLNDPNYQDFRSESYDSKPQRKEELVADIDDLLSDGDYKNAVMAALDALGDNWNDDANWITETHRTKYDLKGDELNTKLRYSDFGFVVGVDENGDEEDRSVIAGGYDKIKKVDITHPEIQNQEMNFSGTAIAAAAYSGDDDWHSTDFYTDKGAATLKLAGGKEKLYMPFNNYYTVTVEKDSKNTTIGFSDFKGEDNNYKFNKEQGITTDTDRAYVNTYYFGDKNIPNEVTGTVYYEENDGMGHQVEFQAAFGMTKDVK